MAIWQQTTPGVLACILCTFLCSPGWISMVAGDGAAGGDVFVPGAPLPLPEDPEQHCYQSAFHSFSVHNPTCLKEMWEYKNPGAECCEGLADYFGISSARPSRNCFCVKEVWDWMELMHEKNYIEWSAYSMVCSNMGYIVPYWSEAGDTYCNGTAPTEEQLATASVEGISTAMASRSLNSWLNALPSDGLVATSLATAIMSGIGLSFMVWPILFQCVLAAKGTIFAPKKA